MPESTPSTQGITAQSGTERPESVEHTPSSTIPRPIPVSEKGVALGPTPGSSCGAPRIAVVMTVYNQGQFLNEAIQSVLEQTEGNFEFVVVDDGSCDTTAGLLRGFAEQDSRIRVLSPGRLGRGKALRVATEALGTAVEFVANLDADDLADPARLSAQIAYLASHPRVGLVGSWVILESSEGQRLYRRPTSPSALHRRIAIDYPFVHSSVCYRRAALEQAGGFSPELACCLDYDIAARIALDWSVANIPSPLCRVRKHDQRFFKSVPVAEYLATKAEIGREYGRAANLSKLDLLIARAERAIAGVRNRVG